MTDKEKIKASKFLSLILRHKPEEANIKLDAQGWGRTSDILAALKARYEGMSLKVLKEIVAEDEKQRYSFSDASGHKLRANQGHSIPIDLGLVPVTPPEQLFHGTAQKTLWMIRRDGLRPMTRQLVHLSEDRDTAAAVGKRHGEPVVILVNAADMVANGWDFYKSENGVWLVDRVPVEYLIFEDGNGI